MVHYCNLGTSAHRLTADKRLHFTSAKLTSATSFIRKTLGESLLDKLKNGQR